MLTDKEYEELQNKYFKAVEERRELKDLETILGKLNVIKAHLEKGEDIVRTDLVVAEIYPEKAGFGRYGQELRINFTTEELSAIIDKRINEIKGRMERIKNDNEN